MKRSNTILLSCAGGPAAIGVIKSLRKIHFEGRIITIDSDPLSAGGLMSDKNYVVPLSESSDYWEVVTDIIDRENVNIILPTGDMDIVHFANNKTALQRLGISVFMSDIDVAKLIFNLIDQEGIINIGGKKQSAFNYAIFEGNKVVRKTLKKKIH